MAERAKKFDEKETALRRVAEAREALSRAEAEAARFQGEVQQCVGGSDRDIYGDRSVRWKVHMTPEKEAMHQRMGERIRGLTYVKDEWGEGVRPLTEYDDRPIAMSQEEYELRSIFFGF